VIERALDLRAGRFDHLAAFDQTEQLACSLAKLSNPNTRQVLFIALTSAPIFVCGVR
jgi:hypothetical protein